MRFPRNLAIKLDNRNDNGSLRSLKDQTNIIDFSSNDYLGLAHSEEIHNQVLEALNDKLPMNGSTGSRLLSGNFKYHEELESQMSSFFQAEASLLFNSGYDANLGLLSSVPQRGDRVFYDEYAHASIRDGISLSKAHAFSFKHNDLNDLQKKIKNTEARGEVYIVVEALYSMDGDIAPLNELATYASENNFNLIVDEAHSTGIFGPDGEGIVVELNLHTSVFARIHTFGKAMGCHGATVVGSQFLIQFLINFSRSFIYTTALPLHSVLTMKFAIEKVKNTEERKQLKTNIDTFRKLVVQFKLDHLFMNNTTPIQSLVLGSQDQVKEVAAKLSKHNFDAKSIMSPTVPLGKERIRFCIHSYNSSSEIRDVLYLLSTFV